MSLNIIVRGKHETAYEKSLEYAQRQQRINDYYASANCKDIEAKGEGNFRPRAAIDKKEWFDKINNVDEHYWDDEKNVERHLKNRPEQRIETEKKTTIIRP